MAKRRISRNARRTALIVLALGLVALAASAVAVAGTSRGPSSRAMSDTTGTEALPALPAPAPPERLGEVALPTGWSLTKLAYRVYGSDDGRILARVAAANPKLTDLSKVEAGRRLVLPALPAPDPSGSIRVLRVAEADDLDAAVHFLRTAPEGWPRLRLCLSFHPETGLSREVIVDAVYTDAGAAHRAGAALPADLASRVVILENFPPGTMLYSRLDAGPDDNAISPGDNILALRATGETRP